MLKDGIERERSLVLTEARSTCLRAGSNLPTVVGRRSQEVVRVLTALTGTCLTRESVAKSRGLTEQLEPDSAVSVSRLENPDSPIYGIRGPATRLTSSQMRTLRQISKDVRLPITQLLKDAVDVYLMVLQREMHAMMVAEQADGDQEGEQHLNDVQAVKLQPQSPTDCHVTKEMPPSLPGFLF